MSTILEQGITYKQHIKAHSYLLAAQDEIYINRQTYNWGAVHIREVQACDIQEVYDLVNKGFYYKQALPFEHFGGASEGHYMFKRIGSAHSKDIDMSGVFSDLENRQDIMVFAIEYPNEYHIKNKLLILCSKSYYESLKTEIEKEVYITMNAYINLVQRRCQVFTMPTTNVSPLEGEVLHMVWFRKGDYRFKQAQMDRVISWIELNPEIKCHLWTDMVDVAEIDDFFAEVSESHRCLFKEKVVIKYLEDTAGFVEGYFAKRKEDKAIKLFDKENFIKIIRERDNSHILIAKTDYLRAMILHDIGGFYVDFNDCQCMVPLKYWMKELFKTQEIIWPCDTFNPKMISNYFMYVPKGSKKFEKFHYNTLPGFKGLWMLMKGEESKKRIAKIFLDMTKKYMKKVKNVETTQPTKLLVETILPVFSSGKFLMDIEEVMGKQAVKGIDNCDPRGRTFIPIYTLDFVGKRTGNRVVQDFYKYLAAEYSQIGTIQMKKNYSVNNDGKMQPGKEPVNGDKFNIIYLNKNYHEEHDEMEDVVGVVDLVLAEIEKLYDDVEFQEFLYKKFLINMSIAVVALTNLMLQNDCNLTMNDVVPFSFAFMSFCYLTLVVHWGEGTSIGGI